MNTYTTDHQRFPRVSAADNGDFVVVWTSRGQDSHTGLGQYGVFGQRFSSTGATLGTEFQVNTYTTDDQVFSDVAADSDGDFVVVWNDTPFSGHNGIFGQRYNSGGTAVGTEFQVNTSLIDDLTFPDVSADSDGDFAVVWTNVGYPSMPDIAGQRYASSGAALGSEFLVNTYTTSNQVGPGVAVDDDGDFVVVWTSYDGQDGSNAGVFGQRYASSGVVLGSEFQVNTYTTSGQSVSGVSSVAADSEGNFVVVWQSFGQDGSASGVFGQRYSNEDPTPTPTSTPTNTPIPSLCPSSPAAGCRTAGKSLLLIKDNAEDNGRDKLIWKWLRGQSTTATEFGDPATMRTYALCIYHGGNLLLSAEVPPDANKWTDLKYKDPAGTAAGIQRIVLKPSGVDKAKVLVKGKGENLPDAMLGSLAAPVQAQLVNDQTSLCLESTFDASAIFRNEIDQLKAKASN